MLASDGDYESAHRPKEGVPPHRLTQRALYGLVLGQVFARLLRRSDGALCQQLRPCLHERSQTSFLIPDNSIERNDYRGQYPHKEDGR